MGIWNKFVNFMVGEPTGERAKDSKGRFVADDKSTPSTNEAYKDGRKPAKKVAKKTTTTKKGRGRPKGSKNKVK
tara:strand:- start:12 stop:233 length:222 start_codon:yes stop_codon:yes gene_type:complete